MPTKPVYYQISEAKLKDLLMMELLYTALDNADVTKWRKYSKAIEDFKKIAVAHYLPHNSDPDVLEKIVELKIKDYKKV